MWNKRTSIHVDMSDDERNDHSVAMYADGIDGL
jgi:hypothetical protein